MHGILAFSNRKCTTKFMYLMKKKLYLKKKKTLNTLAVILFSINLVNVDVMDLIFFLHSKRHSLKNKIIFWVF